MSVSQLQGIYLLKKNGETVLLQGYQYVRPGVRIPFKINNKYLGVTHRSRKQRLYVDQSTGRIYILQGDERYSSSEAERIHSQDEFDSLIESLTPHDTPNENKEDIFPSFK